MPYSAALYAPNTDRPHSVVAFLTDEVVVINVDPSYASYSDELQDVFDDKVGARLNQASQDEDPAGTLMNRCLYNMLDTVDDVNDYETDEEAQEQAYRMAGYWSQTQLGGS